MVIVREDLLGAAQKVCPTMLDYKVAADNDSMYNTPPCWSIYVCGLVFKKLLAEGGLAAMQERNESKVPPPPRAARAACCVLCCGLCWGCSGRHLGAEAVGDGVGAQGCLRDGVLVRGALVFRCCSRWRGGS